MELKEYTKLDLNTRESILWEEGLFIDKYIDLDIVTNLYFLDSFYVEVVLNNLDGHINEIAPFKDGARFEKYLQHIDLKHLI